MQNKWDQRFLDMAAQIAEWSKDPSTNCGAVITDDRTIVSLGFNGFPRGVIDSAERYQDRGLKYSLVVHAEVNAIILAGQSLHGCTIYVHPMQPCCRCAGVIIQAGIKRVVTTPTPPDLQERWGKDIEISTMMFREAGVELFFVGEG